jgi:hypothetical protein
MGVTRELCFKYVIIEKENVTNTFFLQPKAR